MTITVWPVDAVAGAPSYTGRMLRQAANGLWTPSGARPLGARTGVAAGTSSGIVTATSTTWTCGVHRGVLDLEANAIEGGYSYSVDAAVSGPVTAADSTYSRIDIVYVQLSDPAAGDGTTTPSAQVLYLAGAAAASPAAPATPARSMVLAQITVPKAGGGSPSVSFVAPSTAALGGIVPASSAQYPSSPYVGQYVDDPAAGLLRYDGSGWRSPRDRGTLTTADCNTLTAPGVYRIGLGTPNAPNAYTCDLFVEPMQQGAVIRQTVIAETTPNVVYTRTYVIGSGWSAWRRLTPDAGTFNVTFSSSNAASASVSFAIAFAAAPIVVLSATGANNYDLVCTVVSTTATGFTARAVTNAVVNISGTAVINYLAMAA